VLQVTALFDEMLSCSLSPSLISYNTLLHAYAKMGAWQESLGLLQHMCTRCAEAVVCRCVLFVLHVVLRGASKRWVLASTQVCRRAWACCSTCDPGVVWLVALHPVLCDDIDNTMQSKMEARILLQQICKGNMSKAVTHVVNLSKCVVCCVNIAPLHFRQHVGTVAAQCTVASAVVQTY
jgi:pentatricopeptide repeat protein